MDAALLSSLELLSGERGIYHVHHTTDHSTLGAALELCDECREYDGYRMYIYGTPAMAVQFRLCPCQGGTILTGDRMPTLVEFKDNE